MFYRRLSTVGEVRGSQEGELRLANDPKSGGPTSSLGPHSDEKVVQNRLKVKYTGVMLPNFSIFQQVVNI